MLVGITHGYDLEHNDLLYRVGQKVSLIIFAITLSTAANFHNFCHIYTVENLQPEDI